MLGHAQSEASIYYLGSGVATMQNFGLTDSKAY
jgi:hypothetical protein